MAPQVSFKLFHPGKAELDVEIVPDSPLYAEALKPLAEQFNGQNVTLFAAWDESTASLKFGFIAVTDAYKESELAEAAEPAPEPVKKQNKPTRADAAKAAAEAKAAEKPPAVN